MRCVPFLPTVFLLLFPLTVFCSERLTLQLVERIGYNVPFYNKPAVTDDYLYLATSKGTLISLDTRSMGPVWKIPLQEKFTATPLVHSSQLLLGGYNGIFRSFNIDDGQLNWEFNTGGIIGRQAIVDDGVVFFGSESKNLYALELSSGKLKWQFSTMNRLRTIPLINKNRIFFGSYDHYLYCLDKSNGKLLWKFKTNAAILASPVIIENTVYFGSYDAMFYGLTLQGDKLFEVEAGNSIHLDALGSDSKVFFISRDNILYCLTRDGQLSWKYELPAQASSAPIFVGELLAVGLDNGSVLFLDTNGQQVSTHIFKYQCRSVPTWYGNYLILTDDSGFLTIYETNFPD